MHRLTNRRLNHLRVLLWGAPQIAAIIGLAILGFGGDGFVRARLPASLTFYFDLSRYYLPLSWFILTFAFSLAIAWDLARSGNTNRGAIVFWTVFFTPLITLGQIGAGLALAALAAAITRSSIL